MREIFYQVLYLSKVASYLILAVMVARSVLWKVPKRFVCLLWLLVAVRLAIPFSVESAYSLIPVGAENIRGMIGKENRAEADGWEIPDSMKVETVGEDIVVFPITNFSGMVEAYERISQLGYHRAQPNSFAYWDDDGGLRITFSEVVSVENIQSFEVVSLQM